MCDKIRITNGEPLTTKQIKRIEYSQFFYHTIIIERDDNFVWNFSLVFNNLLRKLPSILNNLSKELASG